MKNTSLPSRLSFVTLGVKDLNAARQWYTNVMGWQPYSHEESESGIAFFLLQGTMLSLYPLEKFKDELGTAVTSTPGPKPITLAINFSSIEEVDAAFAALEKNGATVVKPPTKVFWGGYSGYIADPDGYHWEIAHNPFLNLDEQGHILPQESA